MNVFQTVGLVFNGIVFWCSMILLFVLLSCVSYELIWLVCFVSAAILFGSTSYQLREDGIKRVTGINWIEKKFHIDLTEE